MTNKEAIRILETDCHSPFPFTPGELDEACRPIIKSLERLLGDVRKAEKHTENRIYTARTNR